MITILNIDLYCRTLGLGCRNPVGNQMFFNRNKTLRKLLQVKKKERIYATAEIGYPAKKFHNKIEGRQIDIMWTTAQ